MGRAAGRLSVADEPTWLQRLGFDFDYAAFPPHGLHPPVDAHVWVAAPCWLLVLVTGSPGMLWAGEQLRGVRRRRRGRCVACGYDLRASIDQCPECGRRIAQRVFRSAP
jgi:hypothetical protein